MTMRSNSEHTYSSQTETPLSISMPKMEFDMNGTIEFRSKSPGHGIASSSRL